MLSLFKQIQFSIMYYQVFIRKQDTMREWQISCDTWEEVHELIEERKPKFFRIEYYDCSGLVGTAWKYFNLMKEVYITYRKVKA